MKMRMKRHKNIRLENHLVSLKQVFRSEPLYGNRNDLAAVLL